ncbi:DUF6945 domain-containing protein [Pseudomonas oryzihabitans]|uniref:DUF6945 domain-containing protein n=1 Tax=Pseudomonas oryzihabitans TaxID=47885 RepID=UPI002B1D862C|nr:hypothetical protein [Pseudomonas oryzihabitans]
MQNKSNTEQFLKLPYDLLAATSFVSSTTGEIVEITMQQKVIYCFMKQRCEFFTREQKEYYDTLDSVANELSIDRKTVMRAITFFTTHGVLFAEKRKSTATRQKWFFKRFNNLVLVQADKATQKASVSPVVQRSEETDTNTQPDVYVEPQAAVESWANESLPLEDYEGIEFSVENESSSYADWETFPLEVVQEKQVNACPFATAPTKRFKSNGSVSEEMEFWCSKNQVSTTSVDGQSVFKHKGQRFVIESGAFVEYKATTYKSSAPKTLAEASGMKHMEKCWEDSNESLPF